MGAGELRLVQVAAVGDRGEAMVIRGLLRSAGIRCLVNSNRTTLQIRVAEERAEEARLLIERARAENEGDPDLLRRRPSG